jgi:uncharacterized protein (TIGR03067 family)
MNALSAVWLALAVAAPQSKDAARKDPPSLVGTWVVVSFAAAGHQSPAGATAADSWEYEFKADGTLEVRVADGGRSKGVQYTADPKKDPAEIDIALTEQGVTHRGIYKVEGDVLTICVHAARESKRPAKFEYGAGTNLQMTTLQRAPKKE